MGRYYYNRKATAEECLSVSIFYLNQHKLLSNDCSTTLSWITSNTKKKSSIEAKIQVSDNPHIRLTYTITKNDGEAVNIDDIFSLDKTECNFGGFRYWFFCV